MSRVQRAEILDLVRLQRLADRLEVGFAVLLDERFEERHAEHFAFAFVDARGQIFVDIIAEEMAVQERTAAVRFHEQLDGRFLLGFTAKNLRDDAFEYAAIALVDEPRTPGDESI